MGAVLDLSQIRIQPKRRSAWEAVDLGFVMLRQWWKPLYLSWFLPSLMVFCLLNIVFYESPWITIGIIWWLKPLWDRGPLLVASRAMFGQKVRVIDFLKMIPSLYGRGIVGSLLWRRFSGLRALHAPVIVLEQLTGERRSKRLRVLQHPISSACYWLLVICLHIEGLIVVGFFCDGCNVDSQ